MQRVKIEKKSVEKSESSINRRLIFFHVTAEKKIKNKYYFKKIRIKRGYRNFSWDSNSRY
jgi:hypothetical protein